MTVQIYNAENERLKRRYFAYLKEARRYSESSIDHAADALHRFEKYTRFKEFRKFHIEQAIAFKRKLSGATARCKTPLYKIHSQVEVSGKFERVHHAFEVVAPGCRHSVMISHAKATLRRSPSQRLHGWTVSGYTAIARLRFSAAQARLTKYIFYTGGPRPISILYAALSMSWKLPQGGSTWKTGLSST